MPSEKLTRILLAKSSFTIDEIQKMTESQGWNWVYANKTTKKRLPQVCFTGFSIKEKQELEEKTNASKHFEVVGSVTENLEFLCTGPNAGPKKLEKAKKQDVCIVSLEEFMLIMENGEIKAQ